MRPNLSVSAKLLALCTVALLVVGGTAVAHGILKSADPAPDSRASSVPRTVTTTLTEEPVPDGRYVVRDGCGRVVSDGFEVDGDTISARTRDAQPGNWKVRFDFISSLDGHRYNETYSFSVAGQKDCSEPEPEGEEEAEPEAHEEEAEEDGGSVSSAPPSDSSADEAAGSAPVEEPGRQVPSLPLTLAGAAAIGLALFGRRSSPTA